MTKHEHNGRAVDFRHIMQINLKIKTTNNNKHATRKLIEEPCVLV